MSVLTLFEREGAAWKQRGVAAGRPELVTTATVDVVTR